MKESWTYHRIESKFSWLYIIKNQKKGKRTLSQFQKHPSTDEQVFTIEILAHLKMDYFIHSQQSFIIFTTYSFDDMTYYIYRVLSLLYQRYVFDS